MTRHMFTDTYSYTCCSTNLFLCFMLPRSFQYRSNPQSLDSLIPWLIRSDQGLGLRRATSRRFTLDKPYFLIVCPEVVCLHPGYTYFYFYSFLFQEAKTQSEQHKAEIQLLQDRLHLETDETFRRKKTFHMVGSWCSMCRRWFLF